MKNDFKFLILLVIDGVKAYNSLDLVFNLEIQLVFNIQFGNEIKPSCESWPSVKDDGLWIYNTFETSDVS